MGQETESKFFVKELSNIEARLLSLEARLIQPRTLEVNLRFDTPNRDFQRERRVLRLRQDEASHLTYKDGTQLYDGAFSRREIEFTVGNFDSARLFIEALGYDVVFTYEKYRTTYNLAMSSSEVINRHPDVNMQIMLDELPYGDFVEIEGEMEQLKPAAHILGLKWETAIPASYHELFDRVWTSRKLTFRDLTFENFRDLHISSSDINVLPADG